MTQFIKDSHVRMADDYSTLMELEFIEEVLLQTLAIKILSKNSPAGGPLYSFTKWPINVP